MKQLSKNSSTFLFIFLTGILIVVAFISYNKILQFNKSVEEVMQVSKVKHTLEKILSNIKDAEIQQRGYLLTGDTTFLKSYTLKKQGRNSQLDSLLQLTSNSVQQQENFKKLKSIVTLRYAILDSNVQVLDNSYRNALVKQALEKGTNKMLEVRAQINLMLQAEDSLIAQRSHYKDRTAAITPIFLLALSLLSILIITFFFFRLQKETNERILITENNRQLLEAKQLIETSEARFRTLSETLPHLIWTASADGRKNFFNKYFLDYTGFTFKELEVYGWQRIIFPPDLEIELKQWNKNLKTGEDFIFEKRVRHHTGLYRWHLNHAVAQKDNEGTITGWIGTSTDIDDQKKITELLEKTERQFRTFANSIQDLAWTANSEGWIYWYNQRWFDYTGKTLEELEGWGWEKVHHPEHVQKVTELRKKLWKTVEPFEMTFLLRRHDGAYRWFLTRISPLKDSEGNVERWIGTNTDITAQKSFGEELEKQVKERTQELQIRNQTLEFAEKIAKMGSYKWNMTTNELEYSDNLFRLFDCEPQEFIPSMEKFLSFIHPDDLQQVISNGKQTIQKGALVESPYRIISKTGIIKYFRSSGTFSNEEADRFLFGTVHDISEDYKASIRLLEKNSELENKNAELASFSYIASHDLQEPLRKIQAFSKRIINEESEDFSDKAKDYFMRITRAAERMQNLILSLLSFSHTNNSETVFVSTDLNEILKKVKSTLHESINLKNAEIKSDDLPTISAVPVQMHQLFLNLISNSIKYSKPGVAPQIVISTEKTVFHHNLKPAEQAGIFWKISISDNGIGFEQQYENKIFEVFQRLHGKTEYEGTGIGLAICKKIILAHHGSISAIGKPGIGSTFTFILPENDVTAVH